MPESVTVLYIASDAPLKPSRGSPCNGCGVCCLMEPCPLGVLLSCHRQGACQALVWQANDRQYRCGAITSAHSVLTRRLPRFAHGLLPVLCWLLERCAKRWVAAGVGCDCDVDIESYAHPTHQTHPASEYAAPAVARHLASPCGPHHHIDIDPLA